MRRRNLLITNSLPRAKDRGFLPDQGLSISKEGGNISLANAELRRPRQRHVSNSALSASAIISETVEGSHVLKIEGYSRIKGHGTGKFIRSGVFTVGGHSWYISYYPDGQSSDCDDWMSIYLCPGLLTAAAEVKAKFKFSLLDEMGKPVSSFAKESEILCVFSSKRGPWGYGKFLERKALEESIYLKDDCFQIRCDVAIAKEARTEDTPTQFVTVPPSDIHQHLGHLFSSGDGADLTFEVDGEAFGAHRLVLAARSSVFKAGALRLDEGEKHEPYTSR
ncbi:hypothetical protein ACP4OV_001915 [Aristida adscensionis]